MPTSPWISHCKSYSTQHGCSYKRALTLARPSYHSQTGGSLLSEAHGLAKRHKVVSRGLRHFASKTKHDGLMNMGADLADQFGYGKKRRSKK